MKNSLLISMGISIKQKTIWGRLSMESAAMNMFPVHILNTIRTLMGAVRALSIPLKDAINVDM